MKQEEIKKPPTFFDYAKQIDSKTNDLEFNEKYCPKYMLCLHYSQSDALIDKANEINKILFNVSDKVVYDYFYGCIPKGRRFIKWAAKKKQEVDSRIEIYMEENQCSRREALLMLKN